MNMNVPPLQELYDSEFIRVHQNLVYFIPFMTDCEMNVMKLQRVLCQNVFRTFRGFGHA